MGWKLRNSVDVVDFNSPRYPNNAGNVLNRLPFFQRDRSLSLYSLLDSHQHYLFHHFLPKPPSSSLPATLLNLSPSLTVNSLILQFSSLPALSPVSPHILQAGAHIKPKMPDKNLYDPTAQCRPHQQQASSDQRKSTTEPDEHHPGSLKLKKHQQQR